MRELERPLKSKGKDANAKIDYSRILESEGDTFEDIARGSRAMFDKN